MASITIEIPEDELQRVLDLFAEAHGYQGFLEVEPTQSPVPNPETKLDFLRRLLVERIQRTVLEQEVLREAVQLRARHQIPGIIAT